MFGKKHSEEARKKMRDAQQFRAVVAFDADGNIVGE